MGALTPAHLIIILVVALLVLGPGKLPETGAALGRSIRDFRRGLDGQDDSTPPAVAPAESATDHTPST